MRKNLSAIIMIGAGNQVIIHWAQKGKWLRFRDPIEIFLAASPQEVVSILGHIEKEVETKKIYAAGFVAYEAGKAFDPALHFRPGGDFPLLWFGLFREAEPFNVPAAPPNLLCSPLWQSSVTEAEYKKAIQEIKSFIVQGATYQVNYSYRLRSSFDISALHYFLQAAGSGNLPYAAFVETDRYALCSFSPELFFSLRGSVISSKPMKGTMLRGLRQEDDEIRSRQLYWSQKNRAENIMIVDMVRNDIGRIAATGTVRVPELFEVEKYDTVWQMTSTVRAQTSASLFQIFQALFPPSSCTGAPKVQTTRIIAELETLPRRIYTGSIGFLAPGRQAQFNVAIRTLLVDKWRREAEYGVGGGIVWDSVDEAEYDECALKAKIVCASAPHFELLETFLWTPEENLPEARHGYFLLDLHLKRLKSSAAYFSFPFNEKKIQTKLASAASKFPSRPLRVRLLLSREGKVSLEASPYQPQSARKIRVCLAKYPVASHDVFLYHKTTNRMVFENAVRSRPGYDEVLLWNERGEVTEFCTANMVVELAGQMLTPPLSCGLLPGTYRAWLLQKRMIKEDVVKLETLRRCQRIYLCNSVRKMQEVLLEI